MKAIVVDNFFQNFKNIEQAFKKIELYSAKEFSKFCNKVHEWPGKRSDQISKVNPFLFNLFGVEMQRCFGKFFNNQIDVSLHLHLRLAKDKDWIHVDEDYSYNLIVYLNNNLESGTNIYENDHDEPSISIKSIKNRAVLLDAKSRHGSIKNYGNDIEDGRLTLNAFIN